jgi:hypothetical protein
VDGQRDRKTSGMAASTMSYRESDNNPSRVLRETIPRVLCPVLGLVAIGILTSYQNI